MAQRFEKKAQVIPGIKCLAASDGFGEEKLYVND